VPAGPVWDSLNWSDSHFTYLGRQSGSGCQPDGYNYMLQSVCDQNEGNAIPSFDLGGIAELQNIPAGTTVRWRNDDAAPHTATGPDNLWNSGNLAQGQAYEHRFDQPGTFHYFCLLHPGMEGVLTVQ
jgi:hypothetical protein